MALSVKMSFQIIGGSIDDIVLKMNLEKFT